MSITIANNVFELTCNVELARQRLVPYITQMEPTRIVVEFRPDLAHVFNYILDKSNICVEDLFSAISAAFKFFDEYPITRTSQNMIDQYITQFNTYQQTWTGLTSKPDYNLTIFKKRTLPYFSLECMDWVKANLDTLQGDYQAEVTGERQNSQNQNSQAAQTLVDQDAFSEEIALIKNNNFLEWQLLQIKSYPDMNSLLCKIQILNDVGLKRQAVHLICKAMLSPRDCHIIKSPEIYNILFATYTDNKDFEVLIKYCMYYAMYIMRQEETIMFSHINIKSRVLFKLDEANKLPIFKTRHIDSNPYIVQLTDDTQLGQTMPFYLHGERRINSKEEFQRRFNIVSGGAFKGIDLKAINAAISGSILIPCVHRSPLEASASSVLIDRTRETIECKYPYMIDTPQTPEDIAFANYAEYYYPSYVSYTDAEYKKHVMQDTSRAAGVAGIDDTELLASAGIEYDDEPQPQPDSQPQPQPESQPAVIIGVENKSQPNATEYNQVADIDISITTNDRNKFKEYALMLYNAIHKNCEHRGPVYIKEIKTIASVKYKIYGPGIPRHMDVFRIPYHPVKMIKKFHVHAVKMYYDGEVTMLRSCVSCLLSGVSESYKWFSCNKIPADVLLKYVQRGISIILNRKEREAISKYLMSNERWGSILKTLQIAPDKIYCCVSQTHPIFRPGDYDGGIRLGLRQFDKNTNTTYVNTLVVPRLKYVHEYGNVITHDTKKIYMPDPRLITSILDYIQQADLHQ